jgi:RNA polymerase sigma factor (sigma-70 family)
MTQSEERRFEAIVAPHFDALYRTAYRLTRSRDDAEDLVQDVCLRAYGRIAELEDVADARAWLMRVQYRLFIDGRRRRQRSPLRAVADGANLDAFAADGPGPDDLAEQNRIERRVEAAWHGLEPDQRALLALHVEGHSLSELEAITGVSKNALSARLHRARARLAKLMGHTFGGCAEPTRMES